MSDPIKYYLTFGDEQRGPFVLEQLQTMWRTGGITMDTRYWIEGFDKWMPLSSIFELLQPAQLPHLGNQPLPDSPSAEKRPIAGIAVGTVFGVIGVAWSISAIFKFLYSNPAGVEAALYQAFPDFQVISFFGASLGLVNNTTLLIGVLLAFLRHPKGHKTIRITSYCTFAALVLLFAISYSTVTGAAAWQTLDARTKGSLIGGLIGGVLGGTLQWWLVLFLFRKTRWP